MRVIRTQAYQGHAVPQTAGRAQGPFTPEVLATPVLTYEDPPAPMHGTVQDNFAPEAYARCTYCGWVGLEHESLTHICEVDDAESE